MTPRRTNAEHVLHSMQMPEACTWSAQSGMSRGASTISSEAGLAGVRVGTHPSAHRRIIHQHVKSRPNMTPPMLTPDESVLLSSQFEHGSSFQRQARRPRKHALLPEP